MATNPKSNWYPLQVFLSSLRTGTIVLFLLVSYGVWIIFDGFMLRGFLTLIPALFAIQVLLSDALEIYLTLQLNYRSRWFTLMIAPGTILHELSHLFAAVITGCHIRDVSLFRRNPKTNVLGYVSYSQRADKWTVVRDLLIGFAPFFGCGLVLLILFGAIEEYTTLELLNPPQLVLEFKDFTELSVYFFDIASSFLSQFSLLLQYPMLWLLLYLELCLSLGSAPSSQDFRGGLQSAFWHPFSALFLIALFGGFVYLTENPSIFGGYGVYFENAVTLLFSWIILILVASNTMLLLSIPLIYFIPELAEIKSATKYVPPLFLLAVFYLSANLIYACGGFLISYVVVKHPGLYLEPKRKKRN